MAEVVSLLSNKLNSLYFSFTTFLLDHLVGSWLISRKVGGHFVVNLAKQADVICQSMIEDKLGLVLNTEDRAGRIHDIERHLMV